MEEDVRTEVPSVSGAVSVTADGKVKARRGRPPKNRKAISEVAPDVQVGNVSQQPAAVETASVPSTSSREPHEISGSTAKVPFKSPSVPNAGRGFPPLEARSDVRDRRPRATISEAGGSAESSNGSRVNRFNNTGFNNTNSRSLRPVQNRFGSAPSSAVLQRYRWWLGQLWQWHVIGDVRSLEVFVSEVSDASLPPFLLNEWYDKPLRELLTEVPPEMQSASLTRGSILREKMHTLSEQKHPICVEGIVSKLPGTDEWCLCYASDNYQLRELSAYVPKVLVRRYGLRPGQSVRGQVYLSPTHTQCPCVIQINAVMGKSPDEMRTVPHFKELTPYYPTQRILLETEPAKGWDNNAMRVVDIITPIGFGQRGLIVAPPRTGKTVLLQNIAHSIVKNQPQAHLIVLLIDERPEEVTDFKNLLPGTEVISSTFDEPPESHVRSAEVVIEKAKRLVETGENVIILLDSITRLARAYNTICPSSGKVLSGGVEAKALQGPKAFFGAARNIEHGGSLTILATALVDTGSKMDEVIFEEFKGTGNMEVHLDRSCVDKRLFPAINIEKSGTRKEELLYHPDELKKIYILRRALKGVVPSSNAMEMVLERVKKTRNNVEFLMGING